MSAVQLPERLNIAERFLTGRLREGAGDRVAVRSGGARHTYAEVEALAGRYATALRSIGVRQEERVLIALPDGIDYVGALFGTLKNGSVVVMVNPGLPTETFAAIVTYTRAGAAVVDPSTASAVTRAVHAAGDRGGRRPTLLVVGEEAETGTLEAHPFRPDEHDVMRGSVATHRDDPAIWLFSGGTTGVPKAVVQTHRSFANTTELYAKRAVGYRPDDITISVPKLYFGYATGSNLLFPFSVGASCVLFPEHPTPAVLFDQIARHRPTILVNVPSMVAKILDDPGADEADLSSLRFATSAGEALPAPLYHRWKERFEVELLDGLGTAEMWHVFLSNVPGDVTPGTLGRPVPGFDVRVRDDDGADVGPGEVGRLWVRGDSRALGYWQNLDETVRAFRGEWFVGGDLVRQDADGTVTYVGRGDDALKVKGKWFVPAEVEAVLVDHPSVREAVVLGVADEDGLTRPVAYVVAEGETRGLERILRDHVLERLEPYKHPREVHLVDELPRTHLGKVDRGALRQRAAADG